MIQGQFICFGGFGFPENTVDVWVSDDGAQWKVLSAPPWNANGSDDIKYDFDDPLNYLRIDDDIWKFYLP